MKSPILTIMLLLLVLQFGSPAFAQVGSCGTSGVHFDLYDNPCMGTYGTFTTTPPAASFTTGAPFYRGPNDALDFRRAITTSGCEEKAGCQNVRFVGVLPIGFHQGFRYASRVRELRLGGMATAARADDARRAVSPGIGTEPAAWAVPAERIKAVATSA